MAWARAPYSTTGQSSLHIFSSRLRVGPRFYRRNDVDCNVGFVSDVESRGRPILQIDAALPGNGNGGHLYGTACLHDKTALIKYLKAF
jgi:hypothetical protein